MQSLIHLNLRNFLKTQSRKNLRVRKSFLWHLGADNPLASPPPAHAAKNQSGLSSHAPFSCTERGIFRKAVDDGSAEQQSPQDPTVPSICQEGSGEALSHSPVFCWGGGERDKEHAWLCCGIASNLLRGLGDAHRAMWCLSAERRGPRVANLD